MKLWGGRFKEGESKLMEDFNSSLSFDKRLYKEDIVGSKAHVKMLSKCGIVTAAEGELILVGLDIILAKIEQGKLELQGDYEDIHSFVETNLILEIGEVGKKLHTARSRNDQVAVDMKLYTKSMAFEVISCLAELKVLISKLD